MSSFVALLILSCLSVCQSLFLWQNNCSDNRLLLLLFVGVFRLFILLHFAYARDSSLSRATKRPVQCFLVLAAISLVQNGNSTRRRISMKRKNDLLFSGAPYRQIEKRRAQDLHRNTTKVRKKNDDDATDQQVADQPYWPTTVARLQKPDNNLLSLSSFGVS